MTVMISVLHRKLVFMSVVLVNATSVVGVETFAKGSNLSRIGARKKNISDDRFITPMQRGTNATMPSEAKTTPEGSSRIRASAEL
jgi:hypothetical protein